MGDTKSAPRHRHRLHVRDHLSGNLTGGIVVLLRFPHRVQETGPVRVPTGIRERRCDVPVRVAKDVVCARMRSNDTDRVPSH